MITLVMAVESEKKTEFEIEVQTFFLKKNYNYGNQEIKLKRLKEFTQQPWGLFLKIKTKKTD